MSQRQSSRVSIAALLTATTFAVGIAHANIDYTDDSGDVNGDGIVDLADAVFLLNWLFGDAEGPAHRPSDPACQVDPEDGELSGAGITRMPVRRVRDLHTFVGASWLVRSADGVTALLHSDDIPTGHAVTLWWVIINNPEECVDGCDGTDFRVAATNSDLLYADGFVVGDGHVSFGAHLQVGDIAESYRDLWNLEPIGLLDPLNAEIRLFVRSHGPVTPESDIAAMIGTMDAGCDKEKAIPRGEVPDEPGECSDILASGHIAGVTMSDYVVDANVLDGGREVEFALETGDVNADRKTDISDAIYLLSALFRSGPQPAEFLCETNPLDETSARGGISRMPIQPVGDGESVVGSSWISRNERGVTVFVAPAEIPAGHGISLWWGIYNNPSACDGDCDGADLANPAVEADIVYGRSFVTGTEHPSAGDHLGLDETSGSVRASTLGMEPIGLVDPLKAEIHLIIRDYGKLQPGDSMEVPARFDGECERLLLQGEMPKTAATCSSLFTARHRS